MPRKEDDSLGQDFTRAGEPESPKPPESQRSLGDQSTFGDAGSSVSDVGGLDDTLDSDMEVVDLSDRYEIAGVIGKGGMGEVLRARDKRLNRPVAIKRILGQMARSQKALARFLTEAQSVAALNHFNIVQIHDYGRAADGPFIIMELVEGQSLQDKLKEGPLELEAAVEMTCQLCDALSVAHEAGIIHRDIKPANILLTQRGEPKLTDFGLARQDTADHGQTVAGAVLGTIDFMPPEQRQDATLTDARSDLWALAATLYQMVTGKSPKIIRFNNVPQALQDVLGKALEEEKDDRYQTATEFRDALQGCLTAAVSAPEVAVDLGAGECPQCHAKNESSRKFCRGCGGTLVQKCLSCKAEMAVWENFCGGCGEDQKKLAEARHAEMASRQQQAEKLLKEYDYAAAIQVATDLRDEPDSRFQQLKEWADQFLQNVDLEREQQLARIADLVQEALQHEKAYDYQAGIHTLEQIPEILRVQPIRGQSSDVSGLLDRLQEKLSESERLEQLIRQRVKAKQVTGLLSEVEALLNLQPNRKSILKLRDQLIERNRKLRDRCETAYAAAERLFASQDYAGCLEELAKIDSSMQTDEIIAIPKSEFNLLRQKAKKNQDRLGTLRTSIDAATKKKKLHGLLNQVQEFLELQAGDAGMEQLRDQLIARDEKNAAETAETLAKASGLRQECRFEAAAELLERIPEQLSTREVNKLLQDYKTLGALRARALASLAAAIQTRDYETGLSQTDKYRTTLKTLGYVDKRFADEYESCQEASAVAERQQALRKKLTIAGVLITLVLLLGAGMWIRSSMRASVISKGLRTGYVVRDKVISMDPQNVAALVGRATERLNSPTPDIDGALSDLKLAEQIDASATGLKPARAAVQKAVAEKVAAERAAVQKAVAEKVAAERAAGFQKAAAEKVAAERAAGFQKAAAEKAAAERAAVQKAVAENAAAGNAKVSTDKPALAAAPLTESQANHYQADWAEYLDTPVDMTSDSGVKFVLIPPGKFTMGSPASEAGRYDDETQHRVQITKPFYLSVHEVTQEHYQRVMGENPSYFSALGDGKSYVPGLDTSQFPVENVTWNDAVNFCRKLNKKEEGVEYGLPTEAQWEYACRAGTTTAYSFGPGTSELDAIGWYGDNSGKAAIDSVSIWETDQENYATRLMGNGCRPHVVGGKSPNAWGLYDMHGNVYEWCRDWFAAYGSENVLIDPTGPASGERRVLRGGSFFYQPKFVRSANRFFNQPDSRYYNAGFRLARTYNLSP